MLEQGNRPLKLCRIAALGIIAVLATVRLSMAGELLEFEPWVEGGEWSGLRSFFYETYERREFFSDGLATMEDVYLSPVDLNGDGSSELIVRLEAVICGNGPCTIIILEHRDAEWTPIGESGGAMFLGDEWENGYRVLYDDSYTPYGWDGQKYVYDADGFSFDLYLSRGESEGSIWQQGELAHLAPLVGTYKHRSVITDPVVWRGLRELLGDELPRFLKHMLVPSAIELQGGYLILRAQTVWTKWRSMLAVDVQSGSVHVGIESYPGGRKVYSNVWSWGEVPFRLQAWAHGGENYELLDRQPSEHFEWVKGPPPPQD